MHDVDNFIGLMDRLVDSGRTVIEHNFDVVARADWVVDLGPDAGPPATPAAEYLAETGAANGTATPERVHGGVRGRG